MAKVNRADISTSGFDIDAVTGEQVVNFGDLTTTGDLANGVFADAKGASIHNFGLVETSGLGAAGIFAQGENAHIENHGSVVTTGDFFDPTPEEPESGDEIFSEGIIANGDRFYIANHGSVHVGGLFSSALVGVGADGRVINFNIVESFAIGSSAVAAIGDRSQVINAKSGEVAAQGEATAAMFVLGEDASALNLGQITVTGAASVGIEGVIGNTHLTNKGVISITEDADASFGMVALGDGHQVSNFGVIETEATFAPGIGTRGDAGLEIVNAGRITTEGDLSFGLTVGLTFSGFRPSSDGQIENRGEIETNGDGAAGVVMINNGHHLINSGRITTDGGAFDGGTIDVDVGEMSAAGVLVSGDGALLENTRTGVIKSLNTGSAAVELNVLERPGLPAAAMSSSLENSGLIEGAGVAVFGGAGQENVVNHGRIVGNVDLGGGNDTFVFAKGGVLSGDLVLGEGDDVVVIQNGAGTTGIADFVAGAASGDRIDVSTFFSTLNEVQAASNQSGNNLVVALDHNDTLVLANVNLANLLTEDFIFV